MEGSTGRNEVDDRFGHAAFRNGAGNGGGGAQDFGAFSDIFENIFGEFMGGGQRAERGPRRGADLRYDMEITLEDAFRGKSTEVTVDVSAACDSCSGTGARPGKVIRGPGYRALQ